MPGFWHDNWYRGGMTTSNRGRIPGDDPSTWYVVETTAGEKIVVPMGTTVRTTSNGDLIVCTDGGDSRAGFAAGEWSTFRRQADLLEESGPTEGDKAPDAEGSDPTTTSTAGAEALPGEEPF